MHKYRIVKYICHLFVLIVLCPGCGTELNSAKGDVAVAYDLARISIMEESQVEVDVLWLLRSVLSLGTDVRLEEYVDDRVADIGSHQFLLLVRPDATRIALPTDVGRGIDRYFAYIQAPFGFPEDRAFNYVREFVSREESGYILTHQFAVLLWAKQTGLEVPIDWFEREKVRLLKRIYQEQLNDDGSVCLDLYAERVAVLLYYARVSQSLASVWVAKLVDSQLDDGRWPPSVSAIFFDGNGATTTIPSSHTTALAMLALKSYIVKY